MSTNFKNQVNAVGAISVGVVAAFFAYDLTRNRDALPCSMYYKVATEMSLTRKGGAVLTPAELEARVGVGEQNVQAKAQVVSGPDQSSPYVLSVTVGGNVSADTGASFFWSPGGAGHPVSACLSYDFQLPQTFDFARGGRLPGLFGGTFSGLTSPNPKSMGMRLTWDERGQAGLEGITAAAGPDKPDYDASLRYSSPVEIPRGRWVHVEQEVSMNTPGEDNGVLRVWIDGQLRLQATNIAWRPDDTVAIGGVWADIGYQSYGGTERQARAQSEIKVSPPRLALH